MSSRPKRKRRAKPGAERAHAALLGVDPTKLYADKPVARLLIAFATVYNDLRGALQVSDLAKTSPAAPLPFRGERAGMSYQATRVLGSVLHELLVLLENERATVSMPAFQRLVDRLPTPEPRAAWEALISAADKKSATPEASLLVKLRNGLGFHYSTKVLGKAYEDAFLSPRPPPLRTRAVYVDGDSMDGTRFMFADAVAEQALPTYLGLPREDIYKAIEKVATNANVALRYLLVAYLRLDCGGVEPFRA